MIIRGQGPGFRVQGPEGIPGPETSAPSPRFQDLAVGAPCRGVYPAFECEGASTVSLNHPLAAEDYGSMEQHNA
jgi:hypothetical protein